MRKNLLSIMLLLLATFSMAQQRTETDAAAIANKFMQNNGYEFNITKSAKINKVRTEKAGEITPYYIFNDTQNGGFVIVGGQESMTDILAYSDEECFDIEDMAPAAAKWLEVYAQCAIVAAENPEKSMAQKRAATKSSFSLRQNIEPLLGEIKYNQSTPYNKMCPVLKVKQGNTINTGNALTGCTQTAQAMVMRYWKWPERPIGNRSYTFSYYSSSSQISQMTLSIDYDEEAPYEWDKILPRYEGHDYTEEQANAIARLMYHCGVANSAEYGLSITNAGINHNGFVNYFSYADDIVVDSYTLYRDKPNGDNDFRASLINEVTQGRPILAGGWSEDRTGGHYYVIDGYDLNSMLHFNLGWNGSSNGYYQVTPVPQVPYGYDMYVVRHIHPEGRLTPSSPMRNVVVEAAIGEFNAQSSNINSALKALEEEKKYAESIICILTGGTEADAENHLTGLSSIEGVLIDRRDTVTGRISRTAVENVYSKHLNADAPANIDIDAMFTSNNGMKVSVSSIFPNDIRNADYRYVFVYTEDNVKINNAIYNNVARGRYPDNQGYESSLPSTIEKEKEYIFEKEIPLPSTINNINNTALIVMMVDGKSGEIVNANIVDLKQVNAWREKQRPSFYNDGKLLASETTIETFIFDEEKSRMVFPVKLNNPLYEPMEVEIIAEEIELGENAEIQLGETPDTDALLYTLAPHCVDSTLMLYLNISDKFKSSKSTVKLAVFYKERYVIEQTVNFDFIESAKGTNAFTVRVTGTLDKLVPKDVADTMTTISLAGRLSGKDIAFIRDSITPDVIDLTSASIVEGPGLYYGDYTTENDIIGMRMFYNMSASKIILPETAQKIGNYAFYNSTKLTKVVLGNKTTAIGNYAFSGCTALERITIPASVKEIGRTAFKDCPIVCVICESETPANATAKAFDTNTIANATLVVPTEAAVEAYKAANVWKSFGNIISYDNYLTNITPATTTATVTVKDGNIVVAEDAEVSIYTFAGKLAAKGGAGEYALPTGKYIVKVGNKAVKVQL